VQNSELEAELNIVKNSQHLITFVNKREFVLVRYNKLSDEVPKVISKGYKRDHDYKLIISHRVPIAIDYELTENLILSTDAGYPIDEMFWERTATHIAKKTNIKNRIYELVTLED
jgi:type III secretion system FlhB-like substrate exporter